MLYAGSGSEEKALELLLLACNRAEENDEDKSEINTHLKEIGRISCEEN